MNSDFIKRDVKIILGVDTYVINIPIGFKLKPNFKLPKGVRTAIGKDAYSDRQRIYIHAEDQHHLFEAFQ